MSSLRPFVDRYTLHQHVEKKAEDMDDSGYWRPSCHRPSKLSLDDLAGDQQMPTKCKLHKQVGLPTVTMLAQKVTSKRLATETANAPAEVAYGHKTCPAHS